MTVSIMVCNKESNGYTEYVEGLFECPNWTASNWYLFHKGVGNALKDAYVTAASERNEARESWERDQDHDADGDYVAYLLDRFERLAVDTVRLGELKSLWITGISDATDKQVAFEERQQELAGEDYAVWKFDSKDKMIECLTEALIVEAYDEFDDDYFCLQRLAVLLRYLTSTEGGDQVVVT